MKDRAALDERGLPRGRRFDPVTETTPREVKSRLDAGDPSLILVDCRRHHEHALCAIGAPGEAFVPMHETALRIEELLAMKDRSVVIYCHTGRRSLWVTRYLRESGLRDVKSMAGGIDLWAADIDPAVPRY